MNKVFASTAAVCGLLAIVPIASTQTGMTGPELATQLAVHRIAAGIVTPASAVGARRPVAAGRTPSESDIEALRKSLPSLAQRLANDGSGFRMTIGNAAHIRSEQEPADVQHALSRVVSVDEARTMTLTASVYRLVLAAMAGRAPNGMVGGRTPAACELDRPVNVSRGAKSVIELLDEIVTQAPGLVWLVSYDPERINSDLKVGFICSDGSRTTWTVPF